MYCTGIELQKAIRVLDLRYNALVTVGLGVKLKDVAHLYEV